MTRDLAAGLIDSFHSSRAVEVLEPLTPRSSQTNELLFFLKPEAFLETDEDGTRAVVDLALRKLTEFDVQVSGAMYISGPALGELGIMDRHYGYINKISKAASGEVGEHEKAEVAASLQIADPESYQVLGGHEALKRFPELTPDTLNEIWATKKSIKLRSGFYVQAYELDGQRVILINGFHPAQLQHFTAEGHGIGVMLLHSNTDWRRLRVDLAGDTFPERAREGSLRAELLKNQAAFRLGTVSVATNYIHLSAGPFEGAFEISNFLGATSVPGYDLERLRLAEAFSAEGLPLSEFEHALRNPSPRGSDGGKDLFTVTEDMNTDEAVRLFRESYSNA